MASPKEPRFSVSTPNVAANSSQPATKSPRTIHSAARLAIARTETAAENQRRRRGCGLSRGLSGTVPCPSDEGAKRIGGADVSPELRDQSAALAVCRRQSALV